MFYLFRTEDYGNYTCVIYPAYLPRPGGLLCYVYLFRTEDSGNYTCVIENGETLDTISYTLKVQGIMF